MGNGQGQAGVLGGTREAGMWREQPSKEMRFFPSLSLRLLPSPKPCSSAPSTSASNLPFILVLSSSSFFSISRKTQSVLMVGKKLNLPPSALVFHSGRLTFVQHLLVLSMELPCITFSLVFLGGSSNDSFLSTTSIF